MAEKSHANFGSNWALLLFDLISNLSFMGPIFIVSCLPFMQASDLLQGYDVIPHGVGAWQVIDPLY